MLRPFLLRGYADAREGAMSRPVLAIDPGYTRSAYVIVDEAATVHEFGTEDNGRLLELLPALLPFDCAAVVIEKLESYGMPVGIEVLDTIYWSGRFHERIHPAVSVHRLSRRAVKLHLCGSARAKDANVRQALMDRYPRGKGTKRQPGPLYGISGDVWAALAVAVTFIDTHQEESTRGAA